MYDIAESLNDLRDTNNVRVVLTNRMGTSVLLPVFSVEVIDGQVWINVDYEHGT